MRQHGIPIPTIPRLLLLFNLPLRPTQLYDFTLANIPNAFLPLTLHALHGSAHRCLCDYIRVLRPWILQGSTQRTRDSSYLPEHCLRRPALTTVADNEARTQDDGVVETKLFYGILQLALHLGVRERAAARRTARRDQHVRLDTGSLRSFRQLEVQFVVDLPLLIEAPSGRAGGAEPGDEYTGRWSRVWEERRPGADVFHARGVCGERGELR